MNGASKGNNSNGVLFLSISQMLMFFWEKIKGSSLFCHLKGNNKIEKNDKQKKGSQYKNVLHYTQFDKVDLFRHHKRKKWQLPHYTHKNNGGGKKKKERYCIVLKEKKNAKKKG